jgi:cellulase
MPCSYTGYLVTQYPYETDPPAVIGWTETATDLGYVAPDAYGGGDIICHRGATNAQASATVKAGGTVVMEWNTWPESHHGPVIDYVSSLLDSYLPGSHLLDQSPLSRNSLLTPSQMASCNGDCTTVDKTTLSFFKIDEAGLITDTASPGTWASDQLIANNNSWSITIPSTIAAGNYVLRHEIIALHSAGSTDGAQNYPQCINLEVTGGGSDIPAGTLGESLYTETDLGILVNIYTTGLSYTIPGPTLWSGGSGATATSAAAGTDATSSATVVSSAASVTSVVPTTFATSVVASAVVSSAASETVAAASPTVSAAAEDDTCDA